MKRSLTKPLLIAVAFLGLAASLNAPRGVTAGAPAPGQPNAFAASQPEQRTTPEPVPNQQPTVPPVAKPTPRPTQTPAPQRNPECEELEALKAAALEDMRAGRYCTVCNRTPAEFKKSKQNYEPHFKSAASKKAKGPAPQRLLDLKALHYDSLIAQRCGPKPARREIPLDPGVGGRSIIPDALQPGDIIVSTTDASISKVIRWVTRAEVSHAMLYIGDGWVIEAIGGGVTARKLEEAVKEASLAVAYRHPELTPAQAEQVTDFAWSKVGRGYNYAGLVFHPSVKLPRAGRVWTALAAVGKLSKTISLKQNRFFCSQLIFDAYRSANLPLAQVTPSDPYPGEWSRPSDIPEIRITGQLQYVGHLKTNAHDTPLRLIPKRAAPRP